MQIESKKMCSNELRKVALIMTRISSLGWDVSGFGFANVNENSGNTYVWLEDYPVTPYIGLSDDEICYLYSCPECGHEWDVEEKDVRAEEYPKCCEECKASL